MGVCVDDGDAKGFKLQLVGSLQLPPAKGPCQNKVRAGGVQLTFHPVLVVPYTKRLSEPVGYNVPVPIAEQVFNNILFTLILVNGIVPKLNVQLLKDMSCPQVPSIVNEAVGANLIVEKKFCNEEPGAMLTLPPGLMLKVVGQKLYVI